MKHYRHGKIKTPLRLEKLHIDLINRTLRWRVNSWFYDVLRIFRFDHDVIEYILPVLGIGFGKQAHSALILMKIRCQQSLEIHYRVQSVLFSHIICRFSVEHQVVSKLNHPHHILRHLKIVITRLRIGHYSYQGHQIPSRCQRCRGRLVPRTGYQIPYLVPRTADWLSPLWPNTDHWPYICSWSVFCYRNVVMNTTQSTHWMLSSRQFLRLA